MQVKKLFLLAIATAMAFTAEAAGLLFTQTGSYQPVEITPETSTGLEKIYVLYNTSGVIASYTASSATADITWERYTNSGGGYAEPVAFEKSGNTTTCRLDDTDCGYIIREDGRAHCFWITNYNNHRLNLQAVEYSSESDCGSALLNVMADNGGEIRYYTINGAPRSLSRDITIDYYTLEYDETNENYRQTEKSDNFDHITELMRVEAPLCDTQFTVRGDRFLSQWGLSQQVSTTTITARAVEAHTEAIQTERDNDNESSGNTTGLGGSAPVEIKFNAIVSDAVRYSEWQFSRYSDFSILDYRFFQTEIDNTFEEYGTTYVRFIAADDSGDCEYISPTYEVNVGESKLLCPNVFSPGNQDGVNDMWKVSYKSIISFECHIFNRWGVKITEFTDPAQGWDGKYAGKIVPSGVYYYVIKAKGSDGRTYNLSGDINVINYNQRPGTSSSEE